MSPDPSAKGTVPFGEYRTWYRVTGELGAGRPAVVAVHGGPGSTHDYLLPLARLADDGWPVVHYDQLGNGGSTHLPDKDAGFWTVDLFLDELANLLEKLGISDDYVLFGQSWGGPLCATHAMDAPPGLRGLVVANAPASYPIWLAEMARLRAELPPEVDATLRRHEAAKTFDSPEYHAAMRVFYDRHVCRVTPWPRDFLSSFMEIYNDPTVYYAMNGPTEFHVIGSLKDWSIVDGLHRVDTPTLLISGRHDEATPAVVQPYQDHIPGARWEIFEESSHLPHLEEPERFRQVMNDFLKSL
ncbi:proline iminopeptidase-family hydrolase [Streptomyces sp. NBC_00237]|uniref:proline iminopeptidase-family hydrolase n=1 Tax=Streptomyces sp. NBC_00237 TaxID=2975687 RepID=UPI0022520071|nr:proline iminopeptidase-family hydrolase [Streptomyces sp. NBC_00237]MCX5200082.1 proline iminopeptidase-family hydrolase [Streptomyces sp. NBC_00237]